MIPSLASIHFRYFQRIYRPTPPTSLVPFKTPEHVPTSSGVLPFKLFCNLCAVRCSLTHLLFSMILCHSVSATETGTSSLSLVDYRGSSYS
jgi:hypothetical protein